MELKIRVRKSYFWLESEDILPWYYPEGHFKFLIADLIRPENVQWENAPEAHGENFPEVDRKFNVEYPF